MSGLIAALPMYDWPERHSEVDAEWAAIRDRLRGAGVSAPDELTRDIGDLYDFWRRPDLLFAQTCWGPMGDGLAELVQVVAQPSYDGIEGGQGEFYSSAIVMRRDSSSRNERAAALPLDLLRGNRLAFNVPDSMSGYIGLSRDLEALGESLAIFTEQVPTGGHRKSIRAVAEGRADVAAIDCLSWKLAQEYEPAANDLEVVGWTTKRPGLPFITAKTTPPDVVLALQGAVSQRLA